MAHISMNLTFEEAALIREALKRYYDENHDTMSEAEIKAYKSLIKKM